MHQWNITNYHVMPIYPAAVQGDGSLEGEDTHHVPIDVIFFGSGSPRRADFLNGSDNNFVVTSIHFLSNVFIILVLF